MTYTTSTVSWTRGILKGNEIGDGTLGQQSVDDSTLYIFIFGTIF